MFLLTFSLPAILPHCTIQSLLATLANPASALKRPKETQRSLRPFSSCEWNSFAICPGRKQHFDLNEWQMATIRSERDYWEGVVYGKCLRVCVHVCEHESVYLFGIFRRVCSDPSLKGSLQDLFMGPSKRWAMFRRNFNKSPAHTLLHRIIAGICVCVYALLLYMTLVALNSKNKMASCPTLCMCVSISIGLCVY